MGELTYLVEVDRKDARYEVRIPGRRNEQSLDPRTIEVIRQPRRVSQITRSNCLVLSRRHRIELLRPRNTLIVPHTKQMHPHLEALLSDYRGIYLQRKPWNLSDMLTITLPPPTRRSRTRDMPAP